MFSLFNFSSIFHDPICPMVLIRTITRDTNENGDFWRTALLAVHRAYIRLSDFPLQRVALPLLLLLLLLHHGQRARRIPPPADIQHGRQSARDSNSRPFVRKSVRPVTARAAAADRTTPSQYLYAPSGRTEAAEAEKINAPTPRLDLAVNSDSSLPARARADE